MESCVAPRLLYGLQACFPSKQQMKKIEACWHQLLRSMVRGGWKRVSNDPENPDFRYVLTNKSIERILKCNKTIRGIAISHHMRYFGHVARMRNTSLTKKMMFADSQRLRSSDPWKSIAEMIGSRQGPDLERLPKPIEIPGNVQRATHLKMFKTSKR